MRQTHLPKWSLGCNPGEPWIMKDVYTKGGYERMTPPIRESVIKVMVAFEALELRLYGRDYRTLPLRALDAIYQTD